MLFNRKDSNGIFLYPVTDSIAPGYSDIIEQAMDFSTMKTKVDNNKYANVADYRVNKTEHVAAKLDS